MMSVRGNGQKKFPMHNRRFELLKNRLQFKQTRVVEDKPDRKRTTHLATANLTTFAAI